MSKHISLGDHQLLTVAQREAISGHRGGVLWFTGLSGSGKSTIANLLDKTLHQQQRHSFLMDGDVLRTGINADLGFAPEDRAENIRRITEVSRLFAEAGLLAIVSAISPYRKDRELAKERIGAERFVEIYVNTPVEVCEARDPKGLYQKARSGVIKGFTGIDAPYEAPENPSLELDTQAHQPEELVQQVIQHLQRRDFFPSQK